MYNRSYTTVQSHRTLVSNIFFVQGLLILLCCTNDFIIAFKNHASVLMTSTNRDIDFVIRKCVLG